MQPRHLREDQVQAEQRNPAQIITPQVIPSTPIIASLRERLMAVCETKKKSGPGLISAMICTSATVRKSISIVNSQENNEEGNYSGTFSAS
jgi:hypothetical protein